MQGNWDGLSSEVLQVGQRWCGRGGALFLAPMSGNACVPLSCCSLKNEIQPSAVRDWKEK